MIVRWWLGWVLVWSATAVAVSAHREHKVHNIVLYPDKHSWCKTTPIKQVVGAVGCSQVEVDNSVCVGGCFSYTIPRTVPTSPGQVQPYCDSCQPIHVTWKPVTLKCNPKEVEGGVLVKKVEVIEDCGCMSCSRNRNLSEELIMEMMDSSQEEEDSTQHIPSSPQAALHHHHHQPIQVSQVISLDSLDSVTRENLSNMLKMADSANEEVNRISLNDILSQKESLKPHHYNTLHHTKQKDDEDKVDVKMETLKHEQTSHQPQHHHSHKHHPHHVHGPHHSMVISPDDLPARTLDVDEEELKPALEGSQIAYHPHDTERHHHSPHH